MEVMRKTSPGPITYILPAVEGLPSHFIKDGKVALRIPDNDFILMTAETLGPMALTSANISGHGGAVKAIDVSQDLSDNDLLIIEDDGSLSGSASEIVDLSGGSLKVFRGGKIKIDEILRED
jgi:tRNA A37 threonylcarbamoyladenosine synthetase subunit TsaC/SUA5/YrdC